VGRLFAICSLYSYFVRHRSYYALHAVLYSILAGGKPMAYKVFFKENGPFALADTPEDAAALLRLGAGSAIDFIKLKGTILPAEQERVRAFWLETNKNASRFLTHLLNHPEGVTGEKFAEEIGLAPEKFGGVLGGASKIAKKHNLKFNDFVSSEMRTEGTRRYRWLCPGSLLLKYKEDFKPGVIKLAGKPISVGA